MNITFQFFSERNIPMIQRLFTRENRLALLLCLIAIAVLIATTDSAPRWIYQGF
jgi:hypothetical protein